MTPDDFTGVDLERLRNAGNWQDQYRLLMEWGRRVEKKETLRTAANRLKGCAAPAWLHYASGEFHFDSESRIINGLAALLLNTARKRDLRELTPDYWSRQLQELGLARHLTPSRSNGFKALVQRVYEVAQGADFSITDLDSQP